MANYQLSKGWQTWCDWYQAQQQAKYRARGAANRIRHFWLSRAYNKWKFECIGIGSELEAAREMYQKLRAELNAMQVPL